MAVEQELSAARSMPIGFMGRLGVVLFLILAVSVLLVGCGDDDGSSAAGDACRPRTITVQSEPSVGPTPPSLPSGDDGLALAIADSFCSTFVTVQPDGEREERAPRPVLPADEATCIGEGLVDDLGAERARESGLGTFPWSVLGFGLSNNMGDRPGNREIDRDQAEAIADTFRGCSESWELLLIQSVTEGADGISDESARCVSDELPDDTSEEMLVGELDRAYDDPSQPGATPFGELIQPLIDAFDECLTGSEQERLDFN
jgi:hypothetical protein